VLAARCLERLEALAARFTASRRRALAVPCDTTRDGDLEQAVARARQTFGRVDVVVANAGSGMVGPLATLTVADYRRQFGQLARQFTDAAGDALYETTVFGVLATVIAMLDELKRPRGHLVLLGSVAGDHGTRAARRMRCASSRCGRSRRASGTSRPAASPSGRESGVRASAINRIANEGRRHREISHAGPWR
jgi:NADP-dependent 3-hydroxy acid dehydrogenase YdfG